jgi:hypothetical protein
MQIGYVCGHAPWAMTSPAAVSRLKMGWMDMVSSLT